MRAVQRLALFGREFPEGRGRVQKRVAVRLSQRPQLALHVLADQEDGGGGGGSAGGRVVTRDGEGVDAGGLELNGDGGAFQHCSVVAGDGFHCRSAAAGVNSPDIVRCGVAVSYRQRGDLVGLHELRSRHGGVEPRVRIAARKYTVLVGRSH